MDSVISEPLYKPRPAGFVDRVEKSAPTAPNAPLNPLNLDVPPYNTLEYLNASSAV